MTDRRLAPEAQARQMTLLDFGSKSRRCLRCVGGCSHAHPRDDGMSMMEQGTRPLGSGQLS